MKIQCKLGILFLWPFLVAGQAGANTFSSMYVLGDSLSDAGASPSAVMSIYKLIGGACDPGHPCPPYVEGHYSNGPTAVEYLADSILSGGANPSNFYDFAVAGSTTGIGNFGDNGSQSTIGFFGLPGMQQQLGVYSTGFAAGVGDNALHVVWGGANDFLTLDSPVTAAQNIANSVAALASGGADTVLVPNIPDLGATPFALSGGTDAINAASLFSISFNQALASELADLAPVFPATDIAQFDTFGFFNDILANPGAYGFSNTTDACVTLPAVCSDPDSYLFWDDFHPTTALHALAATAMLNQVPLPGAMILFLTGLFACFSQAVYRKKLG